MKRTPYLETVKESNSLMRNVSTQILRLITELDVKGEHMYIL